MRSLVAVVDAGAISGAAERLGVTQPALSRRIQQLEEQMGVTLLSRGRKGVSLTAVGELVASEARVLLARYEHLQSQVAAHRGLEGGTVRIGGGATAVSFLLPSAFAQFQQHHPGVRFQVKEAGSREIERDVVSGRLELGVVTLPVESRELIVHRLVDDQIVLIARNESSNRGPLGLSQLNGASLVGFEARCAIRRIIDDALRAAGVEMNVVMELRSIPAIIRMVEATGNLAFVSRFGVTGLSRVTVLPVGELSIQRTLALVARRGAVLSPAANAFGEQLKRFDLTPVMRR